MIEKRESVQGKPSRSNEDRWSSIQKRMEEARSDLERAGSVQRKLDRAGNLVWVIRFRVHGSDSKEAQRSLHLGSDPVIVAQARQLLAEWQSVGNPARSPDPTINSLWQDLRTESLLLPRRERAAFISHHQSAGQDLRALWSASATWPTVLRRRRLVRRRGRPRRGRLVWREGNKVANSNLSCEPELGSKQSHEKIDQAESL